MCDISIKLNFQTEKQEKRPKTEVHDGEAEQLQSHSPASKHADEVMQMLCEETATDSLGAEGFLTGNY